MVASSKASIATAIAATRTAVLRAMRTRSGRHAEASATTGNQTGGSSSAAPIRAAPAASNTTVRSPRERPSGARTRPPRAATAASTGTSQRWSCWVHASCAGSNSTSAATQAAALTPASSMPARRARPCRSLSAGGGSSTTAIVRSAAVSCSWNIRAPLARPDTSEHADSRPAGGDRWQPPRVRTPVAGSAHPEQAALTLGDHDSGRGGPRSPERPSCGAPRPAGAPDRCSGRVGPGGRRRRCPPGVGRAGSRSART